ncbi:adenylate/guanylate cyclase domain-containing protein [Deinococcus taeanensis]|uniref:adenylate/guanylate cyclase domain-containing protein n=1 Tax=Deinococcus taeanensis TaxID=2737050 RepID=UPI001CDBF0CA|nr:adenylate/guanylate cyclase domain-containing protein [Deinococcus taeanensis]UBV42632.1 adenylate/guanylate cyclase domain-containing protein [Deinococcus taeanensis]
MADLLLPLPGPQDHSTPACMVLVDLVGSTVMAQTLDLSAYMALMQEFVQVMILTMEARGGQVLQHQGDAVLAWWPALHAVQACSAAQEAHGRAARLALAGHLGVDLRVRAGISSGPVLMGVVGGQLSAYGLPVNYARRLCDAACPGETLICDDVRREHPSLMSEPCPPMPLQGFGAHCTAHRLVRAPYPRMKVD